MNLNIIAACSDLGVHIDGSNFGPLKLKETLENEEIILVEKKETVKEKEHTNKRKNFDSLNEFNERLYNKILSINNFVLTIGGDHSITIASALASKKKHENIGVIWIDSHSDFHTLDTTISGNIHGMPFATICGQNKDSLSYFFNGKYFNPKNSVLVGARDIDDPEYINLKDAGVKFFTTNDIKEKGVKKIMEEAFKIAKENTDGIHISYDLDVIDPTIAPGVSIKAKDGINENEAFEILDEIIKEKKLIKSFDLVEFNPLYDTEDKTYNIAKKMLEIIIKNFQD